jgi:glycosyltransferase involved in cell wall biosynthesis
MKLLHLLASGHLGGAETLCLELCRQLAARGHSVSVFSFGRGEVERRARELKLRFHAIELPASSEARGRRWQRMALLLQEHVRAEQPDLIHSHLPITNLLCAKSARTLHRPWLCTIHGSWRQFAYAPATIGRPWRRPLLLARHAVGDWWTTRTAARIVAISNYVADELHAVGIARPRIEVVYNGLDFPPLPPLNRAEARAALGIADEELLISAIGFLAPVKGFDLLINACAQIAKVVPAARTIIVGRGVLGDQQTQRALVQQVEQTGLKQRVTFEEQSAQMPLVLAAADLFVVPSRSEGFSLVLLQAMQNGLPSVVTSAGGCAEVARPGHESLMYRSPNVNELANKLIRLLQDPQLRAQLGAAARARAAQFTTTTCAESYERVYRQVMGAQT